MAIGTLDADKCAQRNRVAARRDSVEAAPVRILAAAPAPSSPDGLLYAHGTLPATPEAALERINALRGDGAEPLTPQDVYIHYLEAANGNFVQKYWFFLGETTLRNIARDAQAGVAFMNSHRSGGLSHPSELPFGRTFAGRYEQDKSGAQRALLGVYMVRGIRPNGDSGPSTDDLHAMVDAGTLFDVSVGLKGGEQICDLCANPVGARDKDGNALCGHVPGTRKSLGPEQIASQKARGVPGGTASYSLVDAHMGEVSAVYDGAVPGAGFRKALSMYRDHQLSPLELSEARGAYRALLGAGDLSMDEITEVVEAAAENTLTRVLKSFGFKPNRAAATARAATGEQDDDAEEEEEEAQIKEPYQGGMLVEGTLEEASATMSTNNQNQSSSIDLEAQQRELEELRARNRELEADKRNREAKTYADGYQLQKHKLYPAGRESLVKLKSFLLEVSESGLQLESGTSAGQGEVLLDQLLESYPAHHLLEERVPTTGTRNLYTDSSVPTDKAPASEEYNQGVEEGKRYAAQLNGAGGANASANGAASNGTH